MTKQEAAAAYRPEWQRRKALKVRPRWFFVSISYNPVETKDDAGVVHHKFVPAFEPRTFVWPKKVAGAVLAAPEAGAL